MGPSAKPVASCIDALVAERFVLCYRQITPAIFDGVVALCSAAGFSPNIVNTSATWSGVLTLVESGEGVALVPSGVRYLRPSGVVISPLVPQNLHMGLAVAWNPENEGPILQDFLNAVAAGEAVVPIDRVYAFDQIVEAHAAMEAGAAAGKLVITT